MCTFHPFVHGTTHVGAVSPRSSDQLHDETAGPGIDLLLCWITCAPQRRLGRSPGHRRALCHTAPLADLTRAYYSTSSMKRPTREYAKSH